MKLKSVFYVVICILFQGCDSNRAQTSTQPQPSENKNVQTISFREAIMPVLKQFLAHSQGDKQWWFDESNLQFTANESVSRLKALKQQSIVYRDIKTPYPVLHDLLPQIFEDFDNAGVMIGINETDGRIIQKSSSAIYIAFYGPTIGSKQLKIGQIVCANSKNWTILIPGCDMPISAQIGYYLHEVGHLVLSTQVRPETPGLRMGMTMDQEEGYMHILTMYCIDHGSSGAYLKKAHEIMKKYTHGKALEDTLAQLTLIDLMSLNSAAGFQGLADYAARNIVLDHVFVCAYAFMVQDDPQKQLSYTEVPLLYRVIDKLRSGR